MGYAIRTFVGVGLLASTCAVIACGGGSGGGGSPSTPASLLSGSYLYLYLDRDVAGDSVYSEVATFTADGAGGVVFDEGWQTGDGGPGAAVRRANSTYDVSAERDLTVAGGFPSALTGRLSSGGSYAIAAALSATRDPGWFCAVRRDTSPSVADVVGSWRFVELRRGGSSTDDAVSNVGRITVDAAGSISHSEVHMNHDGSIDPGGVIYVPSNFEVGGPSGLRIFVLGSLFLEGGMSASGDVMLLGGRAVGAAAVARVMVREGRAAGDAALQGMWGMAGFAATRPGYACFRGETQFDGTGDGTWGESVNLDGTPGISIPFAIEYGVGIDGQATLLWPGTAVYGGGAVPGFAVFGGPLTPLRGPSLHALVR